MISNMTGRANFLFQCTERFRRRTERYTHEHTCMHTHMHTRSFRLLGKLPQRKQNLLNFEHKH